MSAEGSALPAKEGPTINFSAALTVWRDIGLGDLQKTLDQQGLEIVENQKESITGRKKLAEQTREFKKVPDEDKSTAFKTLLKAYQSEIDALTKRSKAAENAFLNVYKLLAEAPDPYPLLDAAVDQTARASEARLLEAEVARQKDEMTFLKQQAADAVNTEKEKKRLQEKVEKLEARLETMVQEKVSAKEAELHATYDERLRNYEEREKDLQRQVSTARTQLRELRSTNDSSQARLFESSERQGQEIVARLAEADLVQQDLERANARVAEVERRNEKLRAEVEAVRSGAEAAGRVSALEAQIADLQTEASRLIRSLEVQKAANEDEQKRTTKQIEDLTKDRDAKAGELVALRDKVRQFADYDEIKRELEIMKYVEFGGMDPDETFDGNDTFDSIRMPDPNADKANAHRGKPLENLLMSKNRRLQDEVTQLRVAYEELAAEHREISNDLESLHSRYEEQRLLNDRLENDLLRLNEAGNGGGASTTSSTSTRQDPLANLQLGKKSSTNLNANAGGGAANGASATVTTSDKTPTSAADASILPIITSQRDRFRQRTAELEEELRKQFETVSELRNEVKNVQNDNLKMYEKVRYLQSYRGGAGAAGDDAAGGGLPFASSSGAGSRGFAATVRGDEDLHKYRNKYEESMNPFEAFRGRERGRAMSMLGPLEKILLHLASIVLGSRASRNAFVVYALALHFIVLSVLYSWATHGGAVSSTIVTVPPPV